MRQVSTQEELQAALLAQEDEIQVVADFDVSTPQTVSYPLLLRSAPAGPVHTLFKTAGFSGSLLRVAGGGALVLEDLILDGSAAGSYLENPANRTLVQALGGSIHLSSGAVLQNNSSYQEGGGLYLSGDASYVNSLLMDGDAVIRGCSSRTSGGGLTAALRNNGDSVRLEGAALIEQNTAANGGGVYLRSYLPEVGGALSIGEGVRVRENRAATNGGGIYCSSFSSGGSVPISLTVEGTVEIANNQAGSGGGIFFYSASPGDRLVLTGAVRITGNTVTGSGGGVHLNAPRDGVSLGIQGAAITGNQAGNGGGIYLRTTAGGILEVTGQTLLSGNTAAGASSSAGGGLWLQNLSGGLHMVLSEVSILSNQAVGNGGGLFLSDSGEGEIRIADSVIRQNTAGASGGGAYLLGTGGVGGTIDLDRTTLLENTAVTGGGLYSAGGTGRIVLRGGSQIIENSAASGGGIYHAGQRTLAMEEVTINGNTASTGQGAYNAGPLELGPVIDLRDGLYLPNQAAAPTIAAHLTGDSAVQLERSGYVAPNQTGSPILVARSDLTLTAQDAAAFRVPATADFAGWGPKLSGDSRQLLLAPVDYALRYENTLGGENPNPDSYTVLTPTIRLLPLENTPGSRFLGWFDDLEGGVQVAEIPQGSTGDKTLYAHWQAVEYTVTYYGNDAGGPAAENVPPPQQVRGGEEALLSEEHPTREGYRFTGWNTQPGGGGTPYQPGGAFGPIFSDAGLYAQWEVLPPVTHTLAYFSNDAGGPPAYCMPCAEQIPADQWVRLSCGMPCRACWCFAGWNTSPEGTGQTYWPGQAVGPVIGDLCLYAQWRPLLSGKPSCP